MFVYLLCLRPFKTKIDNILNIINEFILVLVFACLAGIQKAELSTNAESKIGWLMIVMVLFSLLFTWVLFVPEIIKGILELLKGCAQSCRRKSGTVDVDDSLPQKPASQDTAKASNKAPPPTLPVPRRKTSHQTVLPGQDSKDTEVYASSKTSRGTVPANLEIPNSKNRTARTKDSAFLMPQGSSNY
jgi:hypothetical protein